MTANGRRSAWRCLKIREHKTCLLSSWLPFKPVQHKSKGSTPPCHFDQRLASGRSSRCGLRRQRHRLWRRASWEAPAERGDSSRAQNLFTLGATGQKGDSHTMPKKPPKLRISCHDLIVLNPVPPKKSAPVLFSPSKKASLPFEERPPKRIHIQYLQ